MYPSTSGTISGLGDGETAENPRLAEATARVEQLLSNSRVKEALEFQVRYFLSWRLLGSGPTQPLGPECGLPESAAVATDATAVSQQPRTTPLGVASHPQRAESFIAWRFNEQNTRKRRSLEFKAAASVVVEWLTTHGLLHAAGVLQPEAGLSQGDVLSPRECLSVLGLPPSLLSNRSCGGRCTILDGVLSLASQGRCSGQSPPHEQDMNGLVEAEANEAERNRVARNPPSNGSTQTPPRNVPQGTQANLEIRMPSVFRAEGTPSAVPDSRMLSNSALGSASSLVLPGATGSSSVGADLKALGVSGNSGELLHPREQLEQEVCQRLERLEADFKARLVRLQRVHADAEHIRKLKTNKYKQAARVAQHEAQQRLQENLRLQRESEAKFRQAQSFLEKRSLELTAREALLAEREDLLMKAVPQGSAHASKAASDDINSAPSGPENVRFNLNQQLWLDAVEGADPLETLKRQNEQLRAQLLDTQKNAESGDKYGHSGGALDGLTSAHSDLNSQIRATSEIAAKRLPAQLRSYSTPQAGRPSVSNEVHGTLPLDAYGSEALSEGLRAEYEKRLGQLSEELKLSQMRMRDRDAQFKLLIAELEASRRRQSEAEKKAKRLHKYCVAARSARQQQLRLASSVASALNSLDLPTTASPRSGEGSRGAARVKCAAPGELLGYCESHVHTYAADQPKQSNPTAFYAASFLSQQAESIEPGCPVAFPQGGPLANRLDSKAYDPLSGFGLHGSISSQLPLPHALPCNYDCGNLGPQPLPPGMASLAKPLSVGDSAVADVLNAVTAFQYSAAPAAAAVATAAPAATSLCAAGPIFAPGNFPAVAAPATGGPAGAALSAQARSVLPQCAAGLDSALSAERNVFSRGADQSCSMNMSAVQGQSGSAAEVRASAAVSTHTDALSRGEISGIQTLSCVAVMQQDPSSVPQSSSNKLVQKSTHSAEVSAAGSGSVAHAAGHSADDCPSQSNKSPPRSSLLPRPPSEVSGTMSQEEEKTTENASRDHQSHLSGTFSDPKPVPVQQVSGAEVRPQESSTGQFPITGVDGNSAEVAGDTTQQTQQTGQQPMDSASKTCASASSASCAQQAQAALRRIEISTDDAAQRSAAAARSSGKSDIQECENEYPSQPTLRPPNLKEPRAASPIHGSSQGSVDDNRNVQGHRIAADSDMVAGAGTHTAWSNGTPESSLPESPEGLSNFPSLACPVATGCDMSPVACPDLTELSNGTRRGQLMPLPSEPCSPVRGAAQDVPSDDDWLASLSPSPMNALRGHSALHCADASETPQL